MRRIIISVLMAAALVGCQEQIEELANLAEAKEFEAYLEEFTTATKTSLTQVNNVVWSEGDKLAIFQGSSIADTYMVASSAVGTVNGQFSLISDNSGERNGDFVSGNEFPTNVALYPYADNLSCSNGQISSSESGDEVVSYVIDGFMLPQVQNYAEKSFGEEAFPMVAVTNGLADHTLRFKNVCGAMKLQFKGTDAVQSIAVEGRNGEKLSGPVAVTIYPNNAAPVLSMAQDATTSVTLDCSDGVQLSEESATSFIIALPPVVFTQGLKVTVTKSNGDTKKFETASANTVYRSSILVMPELTIEPSESGDDNPSDTPGPDDYVDEYGINQGPGVEIDGVIWAPVNCGYHETDYPWGKLYQWGRKYGQGYEGDATTPTIVAGPVTLAVGSSVNNANVIFYSNMAYEDWLSPHNDALWNSGTEDSPVKTQYDPCPTGWRVPTYKELHQLSQNHSPLTANDQDQSGYYFSGTTSYSEQVTKVFFPAAGYLYDLDGTASTSRRPWPQRRPRPQHRKSTILHRAYSMGR